MDKLKLHVGQTVYVELCGNAARRKTGSDLIVEATVSKIGNKYFYLEELPRSKFDILDGIEETEYSVNYKVHTDKQDIYDKKESLELIHILKYQTNYGALSLDQLRTIHEITKQLK